MIIDMLDINEVFTNEQIVHNKIKTIIYLKDYWNVF